MPEILQLPCKVRHEMEKMNRGHRRRLKRDEARLQERDCLFKEVPEMLDESWTDSECIAEVQSEGWVFQRQLALLVVRRILIDSWRSWLSTVSRVKVGFVQRQLALLSRGIARNRNNVSKPRNLSFFLIIYKWDPSTSSTNKFHICECCTRRIS